MMVDVLIRRHTDGKKSLDDVVLALKEEFLRDRNLQNSAFINEVMKVSGLDIEDEWELMMNGKVYPPQTECFITPVSFREFKEKERETGKACVSYEYF